MKFSRASCKTLIAGPVRRLAIFAIGSYICIQLLTFRLPIKYTELDDSISKFGLVGVLFSLVWEFVRFILAITEGFQLERPRRRAWKHAKLGFWVEFFLPATISEALLGDLDEIHPRRVARHGKRLAGILKNKDLLLAILNHWWSKFWRFVRGALIILGAGKLLGNWDSLVRILGIWVK